MLVFEGFYLFFTLSWKKFYKKNSVKIATNTHK